MHDVLGLIVQGLYHAMKDNTVSKVLEMQEFMSKKIHRMVNRTVVCCLD